MRGTSRYRLWNGGCVDPPKDRESSKSAGNSLATPPAHLRAVRLLTGGCGTPGGPGRTPWEGVRAPRPPRSHCRGRGPDLFGHVIKVVSHWISLVWCTFEHEIHSFGALSCSGGGAPPPATRVAPLPRGVRTPHATDGASGGGGGVALRWAGGVASELPALQCGLRTTECALRRRSQRDTARSESLLPLTCSHRALQLRLT